MRLLQSVVDNIRLGEQAKLIRDLDNSVVGLRGRMASIDAEIERLALVQLAPAFGEGHPVALARKVALSGQRFGCSRTVPAASPPNSLRRTTTLQPCALHAST